MNMNLFLKTTSGMTGSIVAVVLPWQEHLEWGLRVAGAAAGLIVAILSIISLWRGLKK
jgi:heme A synthase